MSNRNNDVYSVLVTKGNADILSAGQTVDTLLNGQIGVFDAKTGKSFVAAGPIPNEFFFAVGTDEAGGPNMTDFRKSAGQLIQKPGITKATFKAHGAGKPMKVKISNYKANCETDYGIRVEFRNSKIYRIQGYNQFTKAYIVKTGCCDDCVEDCNSTDANALTRLMVDNINNDVAGLLTARILARQPLTTATHGTASDYPNVGDVMVDADIDALIAYNKLQLTEADKVFTDFEIESKPLAIGKYCNVNLHYHKLLETVLVTSFAAGFDCQGVVTTTQEVIFEEGSGVNIQQKEYNALGWTGVGPYILSDVTGTAKDFEYQALKTTTYDQFILEYFQKSESGWLEYENTLSTIFAIPEADTVTRNAFVTLLDAITDTVGLSTLADDVANITSTDPTEIEDVITDPTLDGVA